MRGAFVMQLGERRAVASLRNRLRDSLVDCESVMDADVMLPAEIADCHWVGFGLGKGVTSLVNDLSIFGVPGKMASGWHAELVKDLPDVDPSPLCYQAGHKLGFGDFVRWVYFANPLCTSDVLGVDFGLKERTTAGVAETMLRVVKVAQALVRHGVPEEAELVLLHPRMIEMPYLTALRRSLGLNCIADWAHKGEEFFDSVTGTHCPACGLATRGADFRFCYRCDFEFPGRAA